MGQGGVERDLAAARIADQHHPFETEGVEHGHQIGHLVMAFGLIGGGAEAAPVVGHDLHVGTEELHDVAPAPVIGDAGMEEDRGWVSRRGPPGHRQIGPARLELGAAPRGRWALPPRLQGS